MPGRKYNKRGKGKKKGARRRYRYKKGGYVNKVPRGVGFIAPRLITRLKYTEVVTMTTAATSYTDYLFRLNSVYDPNKTATGHQPYGFDQLSSLYARYRVFKCRWMIQTPPTSDATHIAVCPVNGAHTFTTLSEIAEVPHSFTKSVSTASNTLYIKGKCYLPRLGGDKRSEYRNDDRFQSQVADNPAEVMDLHLFQYVPGASPVTCRFVIQLMYYVEFFDPATQAQS